MKLDLYPFRSHQAKCPACGYGDGHDEYPYVTHDDEARVLVFDCRRCEHRFATDRADAPKREHDGDVRSVEVADDEPTDDVGGDEEAD